MEVVMLTRRTPHPRPRPLLAGLAAVLPFLMACATLPTGSPTPAARLVPGEISRGIEYARRGEEPLRLDVFRLAGPGPHPAVLVLHPGGWTSGSRDMMASAARALTDAGFVAVVPSYRLAPEHPFPAQLEDVRDAVRWVRANASLIDVDAERVGAFGYSAGAHLAALLATLPAEGARIQAVAIGGAPLDLAALPANPPTRALLGGGPEREPALYALASPITHVSGDDPPFLVYHGSSDALVAVTQARVFRDALAKAGVPTEYSEGRRGHFGTFLFEGGGVSEAARFFGLWLRDPVRLASTAARSGAES
jgi:acetyl esterase/lipase